MTRARTAALAALIVLITAAPAAAAPPPTCGLQLDVDPVNAYGEQVVLHVSGLTGIGGIAVGVAIPPSQAAYFELKPEAMASAAGFRAMAGNSGGVFGTAIVTLALSQFTDKVLGTQIIFFALGITVLISQIWVFMVPDRQTKPVAVEREAVTVG